MSLRREQCGAQFAMDGGLADESRLMERERDATARGGTPAEVTTIDRASLPLQRIVVLELPFEQFLAIRAE